MADFPPTPEQMAAIQTVDRSVLVSAGAGSGKTAVLARRCAYLLCDAPPPFRCEADQLLVLTFTEAAASEMRGRIIKELRKRASHGDDDSRVGLQMRLVHSAQISTVHAFCLWMVRRWFEQASIDPAAPLMSENEARLLRSATLDALFGELYADETSMGERFRKLIDAYGLGRDAQIAGLIQKLCAFLSSLPDPTAWEANARLRVSEAADDWVREHIDGLRGELDRVVAQCNRVARHIARNLKSGAYYGELIQELSERSVRWGRTLSDGDDRLVAFEEVRAEICEYELSSKRPPRMAQDAAASQRLERDHARELFKRIRGNLFQGRVQDRYGQFRIDELRDGLRRICPYVETVTQLTAMFRERYQRAKESLPGGGVLDFSDLERRAYELLTSSRDADAIRHDLQNRFVHILVDEFQDINPLQEAILRAVSREDDPTRPNNLFAVGDVKQSIYRFRLADPQLFQKREAQFASLDEMSMHGTVIRLQQNFRSSPRLLDGINLLFRRLMRKELGGITYDDRSALRAWRTDSHIKGPPIEVHLLEHRADAGIDETDDDERTLDDLPGGERPADPVNPWRWRAIEREAFLIGQEIHRLMAAPVCSGKDDSPPLTYSDIAILLRSAVQSAGPLAAMLRRMGIPTWTAAGTGLLAAPEIVDIRSVLEVLDNPRQDIPLAAVLRSGVLEFQFDEDDLVEIRAIDRNIPFHAVVQRYLKAGNDARLRERLGLWQMRLKRFAQEFRRRPMAEVLWQLYRETGYLDFVGGLSNGRGRRANLLKLHELARQFATFRRQGLHRFLRFLKALEDDDGDLAAASAAGEGENVVRVMTIHSAKGLEFPVVFVAGLDRSLNMGDARGRIIFERDLALGLRVVDREHMIEYPSVAHLHVALRIEEQTRAEELRTLYVAMTRAKEKLFLIASTHLKSVDQRRAEWEGEDVIAALTLGSARSPLDWLVPALATLPEGEAHWASPTGEMNENAAIGIRRYTAAQITDWPSAALINGGSASSSGEQQQLRRAVANLDPLPPHEPVAAEDASVDAILDRLEFVYPTLQAASVSAVMAASEAKRRFDHEDNIDHQRSAQPWDPPAHRDEAMAMVAGDAEIGRRRGTTTHLAFEHLDFDDAADADAVAAQMQRMVQSGVFDADEADLVDIESVVWFVGTPLGRRIRQAGGHYRREFMFITAEPAETFDPALAECPEEQVLVRGIVDGLIVGDRLEIIDFKTDRVGEGGVEQRAATYAGQIQLYARAIERLWGRPVSPEACSLVFLSPRIIVSPAY